MKTGTLYLIPNLLGKEAPLESSLPANIDQTMSLLDGLIAESAMKGRAFLQKFKLKRPPNQIPIAQWGEDIDFLLEPLLEGETWGFVSDCGLPCLADPGALLVKRAHQKGIKVEALVGPSSIYLALMLSGLPGQQFFFHGYLAKEPSKREEELKKVRQLSSQYQATQIMIEAPYRNQALFDSLLSVLDDSSLLCIAKELMTPQQWVKTQSIKKWKNEKELDIHKQATIFLFSCS